jgi:hypothetical protein
MAQTGYTPISIYYSATSTNVPTAGNLVAGELAINTADGKLFYKDSSGVVQVIGTKGGVGSSSTTQVLYNSSGLVVGSSGMTFSSPTLNLSYSDNAFASGLQITNSNTGSSAQSKISLINNTGNYLTLIQNGSATSSGVAYVGTNSTQALTLGTSFAEYMRIDSNGYVGIGTSSPSVKLQVTYAPLTSASQKNELILQSKADGSTSSGGALTGITFTNWISGYTAGSFARSSGIYGINTDAAQFGRNMGLAFYTSTQDATATEAMRIDSSGNLLVNNVGQLASEKFSVRCTTNAQVAAFRQDYSTSNSTNVYFIHAYASGANAGTQCNFLNSSGSSVGSITSTGSVTAYVTASDYRLKENVKPMVGALDTVSKLKPVTYNWINGGYTSQGFIAHELAEIVPDCVTGKKDNMRVETYEVSPFIPAEIDEDGKVIKQSIEAVMGKREVPEYQGIDTSFLVATLTAAIQELNAKVTALESQLAAKG